MVESSSLELLCDEEPFLLTPAPSPVAAQRGQRYSCFPESPPLSYSNITDEERSQAFQDYILREHQYGPCVGYSKQLHHFAHLSTARTKAIRYIILVCSRLGLATGTAFNAVNYLDRFFSMNRPMRWEVWMTELLSVACLSIASKLDEVDVPSLHHLQTEDLDHRFQPSIVQQMELTVLKALDWRLSCVTPYSYVHLLTWRTHASQSARVTHLLLRALLDTTFVDFAASTVAVSAMRCVVQTDAHLSTLSRLIPVERMDDVDSCHKIMGRRIMGPQNKNDGPWSPVSVIPMR
ncbi:putative cyclin-D7-1 [Phoenix dactylifera]|uniref:Cyclin-D7-1 n=1 Tax=Phoenix dactylifera TaxID=42345 RepID=A0A8B9A2Z5_PHODC|nr:putative cyclin-D7-1 [Phoenix dactylifera]XP_038980986.1 putative cyclin-D7-1 [Phoenix dactylifera]XP_038980987.1 putative cyclin-D7-1 [Phoenix dactylifera]XP_038980988.1 putative cyclin-D7-1 [Phoenix dactylifera]XP_038980989.1 putative cyclin-D7-1 [Phoenix dactylifera]